MFGKIGFNTEAKPTNLFNKPTFTPQNKTEQTSERTLPYNKNKLIKKEEKKKSKMKDDFNKRLEDLQGAKFRILN